MIPLQFKTAPGEVHSIASDGPHVYLQTDQGLYKIGSGYGGTVKGRIYLHRPDFEPRNDIQCCHEFNSRQTLEIPLIPVFSYVLIVLN